MWRVRFSVALHDPTVDPQTTDFRTLLSAAQSILLVTGVGFCGSAFSAQIMFEIFAQIQTR